MTRHLPVGLQQCYRRGYQIQDLPCVLVYAFPLLLPSFAASAAACELLQYPLADRGSCVVFLVCSCHFLFEFVVPLPPCSSWKPLPLDWPQLFASIALRLQLRPHTPHLCTL